MRLVLAKRDKERLRKAYRSSNRQFSELATVVLLSGEGWDQIRIAKILNINSEKVSAYLLEYSGKQLNIRKPATRCALDTNQTAEFITHLDNTPRMNIKKMVAYVEQHYQCLCTMKAMESWLKSNNFSYKSKQLIEPGLTPKWQKPVTVYRSIVGWFRN